MLQYIKFFREYFAIIYTNGLNNKPYFNKFEYELHSHSSICHTLTPISGNISSRFASSSEAFVSELLANLKSMFPWYYVRNYMFSMFKSSNTVQMSYSKCNLNTLTHTTVSLHTQCENYFYFFL